ncbi:MAG: restriction endonuclease [Thermomicrobiales bacterium]
MTEGEYDLQVLERALGGCRELQDLANRYGFKDIFQDNGEKVLQSLILLGLRAKGGREGNDAVDAEGNEYELKTVNVSLGMSRGVTTHHHLNLGILEKYRTVSAWYISLYQHIDLNEIYRLTPQELEPVFIVWEQRLFANGNAPLNNPKIPIAFVRQHGTRVWPLDDAALAELMPPSSPIRNGNGNHSSIG